MESERTVNLSETATQMTQGALAEAVVIELGSAVGEPIKGDVSHPAFSDVMYRAYESEINVGIQTIWPHGVIAMIGHKEGEPTMTEEFTLDRLDEVPAWLDAAIRERYPDSIYVKGEAWTRS